MEQVVFIWGIEDTVCLDLFCSYGGNVHADQYACFLLLFCYLWILKVGSPLRCRWTLPHISTLLNMVGS